MRKYIGLILIGCLLVPRSLEAELKEIRRLGFGLGLSLVRSKDDLASPFTYNGMGQPALFVYHVQNDKSHRHTSLLFERGRLTSPITDGSNHRIEVLRFQGRVSYHRYFRSGSSGRVRLLWGFAEHAFVHARRLYYTHLRNSLFKEFGVSFHPSLQTEVAWSDKSSLFYRFSVPALTFVWRNPYSIGGGIDFQVTSLNRFLGMDHLFVWRHKFAERWSMEIQYWGQFYRYKQTRTAQMGIDQLSALIYWEF